MSLKKVLKSLSEVEEALRPLYKEVDGQFALQLDGDNSTEDIARLRAALEKERNASATTRQEIEKLKKDIDGLDPVKAREALARIHEIEDKKLIEEGKVEELIRKRTESLVTEHKKQVERLSADIKTRDERIGSLSGSLKKVTLEGGIRELALKKGVRKNAVNDVIARMTVMGVGKDAVKWDLRDSEGGPKIVAVRAVDGKEEVVYGKDATQSMPLEEGLDLVLADADHLFEASTGTGASNNGTPPPVGGFIRLTRDQARDRPTFLQAKAQADKTGAKVVWPGPDGQDVQAQ